MMLREWIENRKMERFLSRCNLEMAKDVLIKKFGATVRLIPVDLAQVLDRFIESPTVKNAMALIRYDRDFLSFFILAREGGPTRAFYEEAKMDGKNGFDKDA